MQQPTLYLLVGYPGAGKTFVSQVIARETGAVHLWADRERRLMFKEPTHSPAESHQLYEELNEQAAHLLATGQSVIFDTNFNFNKDREHLRDIARTYGARCQVVWVNTPKSIAKQRAVYDRQPRNGCTYALSEETFDRMSSHLQEPQADEHAIRLDGTNLTDERIISTLNL